MTDPSTFLLAGMLCLYPTLPCKLLVIEDLTRIECEMLRSAFTRQRDGSGESVAWNMHCGVMATSSIVRKR